MKLLTKLFKFKKDYPKRYKVYNGNYFIGYTEPFKNEQHAEDYLKKYFKFVVLNHENATCRIVNPYKKNS